MEWKSSAKWVLEAFAIFLAGRFFDETEALLSRIPNTSELSTVDVILGLIGFGVIVVAIGLAIHGIWGFAQRRKYDPFYAVLFYPKNVSYKNEERVPTKNMPRYKFFVDTRTNEFYYMAEYGIGLLTKRKIQWYTETDQGEEKNKQLLISKGIKPNPKPVTESILFGSKLSLIGKLRRRLRRPKESIENAWEPNTYGDGKVSFQDSAILLSVEKEGRSYAMVHDKKYRAMQRPRFKVRTQVTPQVLYRFALGVWTSINPNNALNRLAILEVDNDAFRLTYTGARGRHQHQNFTIPPPKQGQTYTIEVEVQESPYVAYARIYKKKELLEEIRSRDNDLGLRYLSDDVYVGVAVWTDAISCPLSKYKVEGFTIV